MKAYLDNQVVGDSFSDDGATCIFQRPTFRVSMIVATNTVDMEFLEVPAGMRTDAGQWQGKTEFQVPGAGSITRPFLIGGMRFKNRIAGDVAVVSARPG